jgi:hypothetical protein
MENVSITNVAKTGSAVKGFDGACDDAAFEAFLEGLDERISRINRLSDHIAAIGRKLKGGSL